MATIRVEPPGLDTQELLRVLSAVKKGDFSLRMPIKGNRVARTVAKALNDIIDLNDRTAAEFARLLEAVGEEGRIGERALLTGAGGAWAAKVHSVNALVEALVQPTKEMGRVIGAVAQGDLSQRVALKVGQRELQGEFLKTASLVNGMVEQLGSFASEVTRVAREVGTEGKLGGQALVKGVGGTWKDLTDSVNSMASNLTSQVRNIADVTTAVARGDLSKKITVDVKGEILELKNTINTMVDQLSSFASEVTRVAREVGTEGKLGGQALVRGVGGTWKDLTDNVNSMATNLTTQVRGIAKVVTYVANGDLKRKLVLEVKGEIAELADTINGMIDTLAVFAEQVTTVAREVGIEGQLGGQALVPGTAGIWRDLTDNVNQLAANLTTQVRAIAEVATAVTKGDLTRFITVGAQGEVAALKDNINEMIRNLKDTTRKNTEQGWLKTNIANFTRMLQGVRDLPTVSKAILSELAPLVGAKHGAFYVSERIGDQSLLKLRAAYANQRVGAQSVVEFGQGLVGQCAVDKKPIVLTDVPPDYVRIGSALGEAAATHLIILPVLFEGEIKAVIELAALQKFSDVHLDFLKQLTESIGVMLNTIAANMRTESLLQQSQALTEELTEINKRLEQQKTEVEHKNREVENKNREVEQAKSALEEKAEQLALTSKYKSEFLANMSHELRTPLNSLLLLSQGLSDNAKGNLTARQVEIARTIHASGSDLLELINDILDLAKIESGTVAVDAAEILFAKLHDFVERTFRQVAEKKGLEFRIELSPALPESLETGGKRLQQILRNLLSNAFKFTERGEVVLRMATATSGWSREHAALNSARSVIEFSVRDSGIGIPKDKHALIFEAFQQADGTTSRKYGGTGLGLSICRELSFLLGGEIRVDSEPGKGSTFTLYLPIDYPGAKTSNAPFPRAPYAERVELRPREADSGGAPVSPVGNGQTPATLPRKSLLLAVTQRPACASMVRRSVEGSGVEVLALQSSDEVLEALERVSPFGVMVDLTLPGREGWVLLDRIKHHPQVRHIPAGAIAPAEQRVRARAMGAMVHLLPDASEGEVGAAIKEMRLFIERGSRSVLLLDPDKEHRSQLGALLASDEVSVASVGTVDAAVDMLAGQRFDCVVLHAGESDSTGLELLSRPQFESRLAGAPVLVSSEGAFDPIGQAGLQELRERWVILHSNALGHLLVQASLFLHRPIASFAEPERQMMRRAQESDPQLTGRKVLVVDDDVRNIFALTTQLEQHGMEVAYAESAREGISILGREPDMDVVLMDVMMPEMDGYEAMRTIRSTARFKDLPIVALTAKAMKGDREKCLLAGASDYIAKPVDLETLLSLLRAWLWTPSSQRTEVQGSPVSASLGG